MSIYPKHVWAQLRSTTNEEFEKALLKDGGWVRQKRSGAVQIYLHPDRPKGKNIVSIHMHPKQTIRRGTLKAMLQAAGLETEDDLVRVGLIKAQKGKRRNR